MKERKKCKHCGKFNEYELIKISITKDLRGKFLEALEHAKAVVEGLDHEHI